MDIIHALILSIVEGVAEFLPISSTGHLILVSELLKIAQTDFVKSFEISIQLGAILAIVVLYFNKLIGNVRLWKTIIYAFIPTAIVGFALYKPIKEILIGNSTVTLLALFWGGVAIIVLELFYHPRQTHQSLDKITPKQAVIIGLIQSVSVIPGVSRAAATIIGGLFVGLDRKTAVEFSFLLAIPTMAAATALDLLKSGTHFSSQEYMILGVGFVGTFATALVTVRFFVQFIKNHTFIPFGIYRIILSLAFWFLVLNR